MGKSVQKLTNHVNLIASKASWIEGLAIQQLIKTAELPNMHRVAGMPDLHPGRGYPIGAAFFSQNKIYPALVGNDIGCGMSLWQTSIKVAKLNLDKLTKRLTDVEQPLDKSWQSYIQDRKQNLNINDDFFDAALGTIGSGNHFAEFQAIHEVFDQSALDKLGIQTKQLQLLVHSGSRGLGQSILVEHIQQYNHLGLDTNGGDFDSYIDKHNQALRWAELNRELIAKRFIKAIRADGYNILDISHNLVSPACINGQAGWLHRKGATPTDKGAVIIPGSRGDYSYLVQPTVNQAQLDLCLQSLAHGAGRKWKRGECQGRLSHKFKKDDLYRTTLGSRVICNDKTLLFDEAPQAYKDCETVVSDLINAELVTVIAKLRPVLTFKTQGSQP